MKIALGKSSSKASRMLHASQAMRNASDFKPQTEAFAFLHEKRQFHVVQLIQQSSKSSCEVGKCFLNMLMSLKK